MYIYTDTHHICIYICIHTYMCVCIPLLFDKQDYPKWISKIFPNPDLLQYKAFAGFNFITNSYWKAKQNKQKENTLIGKWKYSNNIISLNQVIMSFQRNWRHFTDNKFPRGKHRPHVFCQQFLAVYAMLSHYLIGGDFYISHKEKTESIMLLRMDTALLISLALYQHWWIKLPAVPGRLKHGVILSHSGKR